MGLDQYLNRMPRYKGATARDVSKVEHYMDWLKAKASGSEYAQCTFKEWCGYDKAPSPDYLNFYSDYYHVYYSDWDTEKKHPWTGIMDMVGYWRKANQIHNWFVENIQDGVDDCNYHREVTEEDLMELLNACQIVLRSCDLVAGEDNVEVVENSSVAEELLPTASGFFFGSYGYDEWYVEDLRNTIDIINKVLETTDFETQMLYYISSW